MIRKREAPKFKVRLYLGDQLIDPSDYDKVYIHCPGVDVMVNQVYNRLQINDMHPLSKTKRKRTGEPE